MDLENLMSGALGAFITAVLDSLFFQKQGKLEERLNTLEKEKVNKLEQRVEQHIAGDQSQEMLTAVRNLSGTVVRLSDSTERTLEAAARQDSHLAAHDLYLKNLDESGREHVRIYHHGIS